VNFARRRKSGLRSFVEDIRHAAAQTRQRVSGAPATFATRHDNKKEGVTVIVMQRINDNDLSAHVMKTAEEEYVHLKIEAEATSHTTITFPRTGHIFTRNVGDLLWESREGPVEIRRVPGLLKRRQIERAYYLNVPT
jgi:hypothetical protein